MPYYPLPSNDGYEKFLQTMKKDQYQKTQYSVPFLLSLKKKYDDRPLIMKEIKIPLKNEIRSRAKILTDEAFRETRNYLDVHTEVKNPQSREFLNNLYKKIAVKSKEKKQDQNIDEVFLKTSEIRESLNKISIDNFDSYCEIMASEGAYGEELEIMGFAAMAKVNFILWSPSRPLQPLAYFYRAKHKALIILKNFEGRSHYEPVFLQPEHEQQRADSVMAPNSPILISQDHSHSEHRQASPAAGAENNGLSTPRPSSNARLTENDTGCIDPILMWIKLKLHNLHLKFFMQDNAITEKILQTFDVQNNMAATIYHALGIPPTAVWHDNVGRPHNVYFGDPIPGLVS